MSYPELLPDLAICKLLLCDEVLPELELVLGRNLFCGVPRAIAQRTEEAKPQIPQRAVFVLVTGGEPPITDHNGNVEHNSRVEVYVRSERERFEAGQDLARQVWRALHDKRPDGYMAIECQESEPRYNAADDGCFVWGITLRVQYFS